ncbi:MAG TPA: hypothetical protein VFN61_03090 [Acidimicrobiales bacterium]|nr:hypothetical protein [Acidimicrobiales bacterium]
MPGGRRRFKLLASSVALSMAAFGSLAGVTAGVAAAATFSPVTTQAYQVGSVATNISNVSVTANPLGVGATADYTVKLTTPSALGNSATITVSSTDMPSGIANATVADMTSGATYAATPSATTGGELFTLPATSVAISAGDAVVLTFTATNPSTAGADSYSVATSANTSPQSGTATSVTYTTSTAGAPTVTQSTEVPSVGATYSLAGLALTGNAYTTYAPHIDLYACQTLTLTGTAGGQTSSNPCLSNGSLTSTAGTLTWSPTAGGYTVSETGVPAGTTAPSITVTNAVPVTGTGVPDEVVLTLSAPPVPGGTLTIGATASNPSASEKDYLVAGFGGCASGTCSAATDTWFGSGNQLQFGASVANLTVTPSSTTSGGTANYTISFNASSTGAITTGGTITLVAPKGTAFASPSGAIVTDSTTGVSYVASGVTPSTSTGGTTTDTLNLSVPNGFVISKGDAVTITVFGVTNPAAGSYAGANGFTVSTSADLITTTNTTAYTITPATISSQAPVVTLSSSTPGALATYTIASFKAASNLVAGTDTIQISAPSGTLLPGTATLTDTTTAAGSQTLTAKTGQNSNSVTYGLAANVTAGDVLTITMASVVNPAAGSYTIQLGADNVANNATTAGTQGLAAIAPVFPTAGTSGSYPDGGIVNFSGTFYVFAGGHAFGIPSLTALTGIRAVDPAVVQNAASGATVPTTAPAVGTTIMAYNNPTIYVVGTDGQLHGFATPAQFSGDGYDGADVITVSGLGGITVGATVGSVGTAANAASTMANGAIVNSSGTFYVYAGGKAYGIPTAAALMSVIAGDFATPITGSVTSAQTGATSRNGTLVTYGSAVYVVNGGDLFEFKSMAQLLADGYGGTPSIVVPNVGGQALVTAYSGS